MEEDPNGRGPKWKMTQMEYDPNGRRPTWKTTQMEDDPNGSQPKWKTTQMEDDTNGRGPKWKMTQMDDDPNGRGPKWMMTQMDEDPLAAMRRDMVGIIFQAFRLIPSLTALQNVAVPLELAVRASFSRPRYGRQAVAQVPERGHRGHAARPNGVAAKLRLLTPRRETRLKSARRFRLPRRCPSSVPAFRITSPGVSFARRAALHRRRRWVRR